MDQKKFFISEGLHPLGWSPLGWSPYGTFPVIDVRSPGEFLQGHIPGAFNLPLFTDEERAIVGTEYSKQGKEAALLKGLDFIGTKLTGFVQAARKFADNDEILVHCWRGGMRSEAMAWLLGFAGFKVSILQGGYKAYRRFVHSVFASGPELQVLGGMTGSGKTEMLAELEVKGHQIIDLEKLAQHKGSAFGALGQSGQPTQEQFENDLASVWMRLNPDKPVWIEDESRNIGKVLIPELLFEKMSKAQLIYLDVPFEERVNKLTGEYGGYGESLILILEKIRKRAGGDLVNDAIRQLQNDEIHDAVSLVLNYYDKTYRYGLSKRNESQIIRFNVARFRNEFLK